MTVTAIKDDREQEIEEARDIVCFLREVMTQPCKGKQLTLDDDSQAGLYLILNSVDERLKK